MTERRGVSERGSAIPEYGPQILIAVVVVVLAQSTRLLFPIMFEIGEDWDFVFAGLVALGAFSTPVLVSVLPKLSARTAPVGGAGLMAAGLVSARLVDPIPAWLGILVVVAALVGLTLIVARSDVGAMLSASGATVAVVLGMASDVALRAAFGSWDLVWQSNLGSLVVVLALATGVIAVAVWVGRAPGEGKSPSMPPSVLVGLGAYLVLQLLFLQNFAFVASQGRVAPAMAVFVVLVADVAAIALAGRGAVLTLSQAGALAAAVVTLAWVVPIVGGPLAVLAVLLMQPGLTVLLARAASRIDTHQRSGRFVALTVAGGSFSFLALVLLWSLHLDQPLPVPRQSVPAVAAFVVGVIALRGSSSRMMIGRANWHAGAAIVAGFAVVAPTFALFGGPDIDDEISTIDAVDLVSYNVRGSVGIDGQLAPDRIAEEIRTSDPDIVVIQEAARGWPIHGTMDLVFYLQRELQMEAVYVPAADGQFGNAILTRIPVTEISRGLLPRDGSQDRAYVLLRVDAGETPIFIAGTHLDVRSEAQVEALLGAVGDISPLVIAGDMNIAPGDPEVALFTAAGLVDTVGATGDQCRTTSAEPTSNCDRPDWVFITPDLQVERLRIGSGGASDHLAIHVTLRPELPADSS